MIERDFRNNIVWEEPGEDFLNVSPRRNVFDQEQIRNLFNLNFTGGLTGDGETLLTNADLTND